MIPTPKYNLGDYVAYKENINDKKETITEIVEVKISIEKEDKKGWKVFYKLHDPDETLFESKYYHNESFILYRLVKEK